jgi:hypothetical protein
MGWDFAMPRQSHMGTWTHAASLKLKSEPDAQNEFKLD